MNKPVIRSSSLPQLLACYGSRTLSARVKVRQGDEGFEGTAVHHKTAVRAITELGAEPPEGGLPPAEVPADYKLPRFSEWLIGFFFNHVQHSYPTDWALSVETAFSWEFERFILTGHIDVHGCSADGTEIRGSDYKTCYKAVAPAGENEQVLGYLALMALAYPNRRRIQFDIAQPRADEDSGVQRISTLELNGEEIDRAVAGLERRINVALDHPMQLESGLTQCAWCPALLSCPAIQGNFELMKLTMTEDQLAKIKAEPDDALLGDLVMTAKILERPMEDAKELIKARIKEQGEVVAGNGTRITAKTTPGAYRVINAPGLYRAVRDVIKDDDRLANAISFPMGRLTDAVAEELSIPRGGKKPVTAEKIAAAQFHAFAEQSERTVLQFQ